MAESDLNVFMDGILCGRVHQMSTGDLRFFYDEHYRADPYATPLSLSMPLVIAEHPKRAILPFLEGLITDSEQGRRALAARYGVSPNSTFGLLQFIGAEVAGALQILPVDQVSTDVPSTDDRVDPLTEVEVARMLASVLDEYRDGRPVGGPVGRFSLSGAQPKLALTWMGEGWGIPHGSVPTTHIIKPVEGSFRRIDLVEHMTGLAAAHLGLDTAHTDIQQIGGMDCLIATRYDRTFDGFRWHRLHQEDLAQALSVMPQKKYQHQDGGPGVGEIARLFRGLPRARDRIDVAQAFYQALVFNVFAECTDAHAKNYSVLLSQDSVRLAPLYDLATFAPYKNVADVTYSAMKVGDHYRFSSISQADLLAAARTLRVDEDWAYQVVASIRSGLLGAFESARDTVIQTSPQSQPEAYRILDAVSRILARTQV